MNTDNICGAAEDGVDDGVADNAVGVEDGWLGPRTERRCALCSLLAMGWFQWEGTVENWICAVCDRELEQREMTRVRKLAYEDDVFPLVMRTGIEDGVKWYGYAREEVVEELNADHFYDMDTDTNNDASVTCPWCRVELTLLSADDDRTVDDSVRIDCYETGKRWVGLDHTEPYARYLVEHIACGTRFRMGIFWPQ